MILNVNVIKVTKSLFFLSRAKNEYEIRNGNKRFVDVLHIYETPI